MIRSRKLRINRLNQVYWFLIFLLIVASGLAILALFLFSPGWVNSGQILTVALHSPLKANYSADPRGLTIGPLRIGLVSEAEMDQASHDSMPTLVVILKTPVMTITPLATRLFSTPQATSTPTRSPEVTHSLPTSTQSSSSKASPTPTASPSRTPFSTATHDNATPTSVRTLTSTPPSQATPSGSIPTPTSKPPTNTPVPPTGTSVLPTRTPRPQPTDTPANPAYPPPDTPNPQATSYP